MHFMGKLGLEKVSARPWPLQNIFNLHFKCQQNNNLSVFNVQIIRLYSLGSWNFYVPDNFKIEVSERSRLQHCIMVWGVIKQILTAMSGTVKLASLVISSPRENRALHRCPQEASFTVPLYTRTQFHYAAYQYPFMFTELVHNFCE